MSVADFSAFLDALAHTAPWVVLIAILVLQTFAIVVGLKRKWWVIGWFFEDVEKRLAASIEVNERLSQTNRELTDIITTALVRRVEDVDGERRRSRPQRRSPDGPEFFDRARRS